ncbi:hypothetical protein [Phenylobacterium deserti]|uniref:Uncharacterized protein n=1 Tax=Phenylobacterium deserti TaxID=1914756 RepID=A0A328ANG8_9CAUL|nr:hypothetical protein [Phenylobacterium deserti]RAK56562.1 hypothetical protein DJ018_00840 [Phenylobacterium deserti]
MTDEQTELTEEDLQEMLEEAIDIIAMTLPEDAGDEYWTQFRALVEDRAREILEEEVTEEEE